MNDRQTSTIIALLAVLVGAAVGALAGIGVSIIAPPPLDKEGLSLALFGAGFGILFAWAATEPARTGRARRVTSLDPRDRDGGVL